MVRCSVEELASGVFRVDAPDGTTYEHDETSLPQDIRDKLMLLRAVDIHTRIEGVGTRLAENLYWISEDGGSDGDIKARLKLLLIDRSPTRMYGLRAVADAHNHTYHIIDTKTGRTLYITPYELKELQEIT